MANGDDSPASENDSNRLITAVQNVSVHNLTQERIPQHCTDSGRRRRQRAAATLGTLWSKRSCNPVARGRAVQRRHLEFCLLFGIKSARLHNFVVAIVAAIISASLVLIL